MATTMKAVTYTAPSEDISLAKINEVPKPVASDGHVVVKVTKASINPIDWKVMSGGLKGAGWSLPLPFTMGYDLAGLVEEVGGGVESLKKGDEVFCVQWGKGKHDEGDLPVGGAFAEYALVPASRLSKIPEGISHSKAAAIALVGTTALGMVTEAKVSAGQKVLVLGGSSGVGHVAVQLAKLKGAYVITTCSGRTKEWVSGFGADEIINYNEEKWEEKLSGLDAVLDTIGEKDGLEKSKTAVKEGGAFVTIASFDAGFNPAAHQPRFSYAAFYCLSNNTAFQDELAGLMKDGKLNLVIQKEFPFTPEGFADMLAAAKGGKSMGKNVLDIAQ